MKHFLFIVSLALLFSCKEKANDACQLMEDDKQAVINTDKEFNDYCAKNGQAAAFVKYADSSLIALGEGRLPIRGIEDLKQDYAKRHDSNKLAWMPERGEASGNIGYTFGWWKYYTKTHAGHDTIYQGDYVTVWKKQKDGSWKYVLDGGNDTPAHN